MENNMQGNKKKFRDLPFIFTLIAPFITIIIGYYFNSTAANLYLVGLALFSIYWTFGKKSDKAKRISGVLLGSISLALISQVAIIFAIGYVMVGFNYDLIRSRAEQEEFEKQYR